MWENWNGQESHNHYSPGSVCERLFDTVCGIKIAGENQFVIKPVPGGTLTHAKARYRSIYGAVTSKWEKTNAGYRFEMEIPANTSAEIQLPNGETYNVNSGTLVYEI